MSANVAVAQSTYAQIEQKVRQLTASASESSLTTAALNQYINDVYLNDFAYGIKIDQMRSVYTFFTQPYIDRYPLDVNYSQGVRAPMYVEGILGNFTKDRMQFYNVWPKFPTLFNPISGDGTTTSFSFTVPGPFLSREVVLGGVDIDGNAISVNDDGNGNLQLVIPNPVNSVPPEFNPPVSNPAIPGMKNVNLGNPGLANVNTQTLVNPSVPNVYYPGGIGIVNYVTGQFNINFPVPPAAGKNMTLWVSQYQTGRPYSLLYWNNEFTIRPVPKLIHKVEIEVYMTPVQFMQTTDSPILSQWWKYIAYLAARQILLDRQDMEGLENIEVGLKAQEALVLERQGIEEINQPTYTLFNSSTPAAGGVGGIGYYL